MAFFSPTEWTRVALVRDDVRAAVFATMAEFERRTGHTTFVPYNGGFRAEGVQAQIHADSLARGFRAAPAGKSPHEYGAAIDLQITGTNQNAEKDQKDARYKLLADIARSYGLKAGFYFTSGKPDPYHFEADESLSVMRDKWTVQKKSQSRSLSALLASSCSSTSAVTR